MEFHVESILASRATNEQKLSALKDLQNRQTGKSTRLLNDYIEEFFQKGKVTIQDHFPVVIHKNLAHLFMRRLLDEHRLHIMDVKISSTNPPTFEWVKFEKVQSYRKRIQEEIDKLTKPCPI